MYSYQKVQLLQKSGLDLNPWLISYSFNILTDLLTVKYSLAAALG